MMTLSREDTNKEELGKQTLLRGTFEWAPSRPQIIFTLHPSSRRQLMEKQNYRCAGCGIEVAQKYASKFLHCEYVGRYPVSDFSYRLLDQLSTDPLFNVMDLNPSLYRRARDLQKIRLLRATLFYLKDFIFTCQYAEKLQNIIQEIYQKSLKIWSMYADLEESLGTFQSCKAVYDRIINLKIATPQIIVNYASFLKDNKYFSLEFQVCSYEKGVSLFKWPNVYDIWKMYVTKFLDHYKGTKISQTRDLFIQCLEHCPPKYAKEFYIMFVKIKETFPNTTSARNILNVYKKAVLAVLPEEKFKMYNTYINKAASVSEIRKIREIYEKAILDLDGNDSRQMCINYAKLETKLGEIERARAIYVTSDFWEMWSDFEVAHGNEDTLMEMLRIKRSVQLNSIFRFVNMMSAQILAAASNASGTVSDLAPGAKDGMRMLEAKATEVSVNSGKKKSSGIDFVRGETIDPDEINIDESSDDDDDDKNNEENEYNIENEIATEKKEVPLEVFGNMGKGGKSH
ncbi:hypothetical protein PGB90_002808 [Kerria lacca]